MLFRLKIIIGTWLRIIAYEKKSVNLINLFYLFVSFGCVLHDQQADFYEIAYVSALSEKRYIQVTFTYYVSSHSEQNEPYFDF